MVYFQYFKLVIKSNLYVTNNKKKDLLNVNTREVKKKIKYTHIFYN